MESNPPEFLLASYPRSANHWIRYIIEFLSQQPTTGEGNRNHERKDPAIFKRLGQESHYKQATPIAVKRHWVRKSDDRSSKMILIVRDYREVIYRHMDKAFSIFRLRILNKNIRMYNDLIQHYNAWPTDKIAIKYEDLINEPAPTITRLAQFIGKTELLEDLLQNIDEHQKCCVKMYDIRSGSETKGKSTKYHSKKYSPRWERYLNHRIEGLYAPLFHNSTP